MMNVISGHVVQTPTAKQPYMVVLVHEGGTAMSEHPVATVREGEALIRKWAPWPPKPDRLRESDYRSNAPG